MFYYVNQMARKTPKNEDCLPREPTFWLEDQNFQSHPPDLQGRGEGLEVESITSGQ